MSEHGSEGPITGTGTTEEFVQALERPRTIMTMVKAGPAVDAVIEELAPLLDEGDTIVDGGNSHFRDTQRRDTAMNERGLRFLGVGVSGGEEGALKGPSIMPGGAKEAYADVEDVFTAIAAQVDGTPCCTYVGADGAGHYVKMVHNGIEYADIQLIAEAYDLLRHGVGLEVPEIAQVFHEWNEGDLDSFLIEITATVLDKTDERTGQPLVDVILDQAEQKGTGRWTAQDALELGVPLTAITEAVFARSLSALGDQRASASQQLAGPKPGEGARADRELVDDVRQALYASKVVAYAQGFEQMTAAAKSEGWELDLGAMATIWRGGCIIRARFLDRIREAYETNPETPNLLLVDYFRDAVADAQDSWRRVISHSVEIGLPVPAFTSSLAYYDGYRRERGPASLIQGLRDLFGAHTYRRVDDEGAYHVRWGQDGSEVRTDG
jgi:6-phosphogluconate dehydrogenase